MRPHQRNATTGTPEALQELLPYPPESLALRSPRPALHPVIAATELDAASTGAHAVWSQVVRRARYHHDRYALLAGHALEVLHGLPEGCANTCLTSPPYWSARDYEADEQIGLERDVDDYVRNLVLVFRELRRVLHNDGTVWLNLGDIFFHTNITINGKPPKTGWRRNKQLTLVPFRVALALQEDGWWLRNAVVWHKPNAMPSSVRDRFTTTWEPVFLFAKSDRYFFNLDAVRLPHVTDDTVERQRAERGSANGKAKDQPHLRRWLNSPRHRATIEGLREIRRRPNAPQAVDLAAYLRRALKAAGKDIHWVARHLQLPFERTRHYFRTDSIGSRLPPEDVWDQLKTLLDLDTAFDDAMAVEVGDNVFRNHPNGRNPGDFISVSVDTRADAHFATMPSRLAERLLKATLPSGGIAIDPFTGSGTTGVEALKLGGRFIGIDIRRDYLKQLTTRLNALTATRAISSAHK